MRIALGIQYNGFAYHGWQAQPDLVTVQGSLEQALAKVATSPVQVTCAGRTDTGVHAICQVVHFDSPVKRDMRAWIFGTNSYLPRDISVQWAHIVPDDFHARHSAKARHYRYFIYNHRAKPAALANQVTWHYVDLNAAFMHAAAQHLVGEHDFSAYRAVGCQAKSPVRQIHALQVVRQEHMIIIDVCANGFLHHMVRNIVGVLLKIGAGKAPTHWAQEVLESRDRRLGGITAPAYGLYFVKAEYASEFKLPETIPPLLIL